MNVLNLINYIRSGRQGYGVGSKAGRACNLALFPPHIKLQKEKFVHLFPTHMKLQKGLICSLLLSTLAHAEPVKIIRNGYTGQRDYITKIDTTTIVAGTNLTVTASTTTGTVTISNSFTTGLISATTGLTGILAGSNFPALTGDTTTQAGSLSSSLTTSIGARHTFTGQTTFSGTGTSIILGGTLRLFSDTSANITASTPPSVGELVYCNNCLARLCLSTGTAVGAYALVLTTGSRCQ